MQEEAANELVTQSPHHRSEGHVKECLDAVPEAILDSPVSSSGMAANPNLYDMDHEPMNGRSASDGLTSREWVSRSPEQVLQLCPLTKAILNSWDEYQAKRRAFHYFKEPV